MNTVRVGVLAALAAVLVACGSVGDPPASAGGDSGGAGVDETPNGDAPPIDHPPGDAQVKSAGSQRLSVPQLRASLPVLFGDDADGDGVTWKVGTANGLDKFSDTLGEADFLNTTADQLEPSPLYAKFMDDAARSVCGQRLDLDYALADAQKRVLLRHVETTDTTAANGAKVDQNLRYLKLRMHGVKIADADTTTIAPLRELFTSATDAAANGKTPTAANVKEGWRAVCAALVTAPEMHLY